ncbi:MAG: DNA topoisomerase [Oscillospiraceae bacterium]|nr:DNA topoisomerase [Oscillospiraceae bacterium]
MSGFSLCIAEKPSVAKDIARVIGAGSRRDGYYEGNGYLVTWAVGHLVGLAEPEKYGFVPQREMYGEARDKAYAELPLIPEEFQLVVLDATKDQYRIVKELMNRPDVELVIDCGDMGAEGHILQWFIREMAGCEKPVKRFCATSMTDEAIRAAMEKLRPIEDFENIIRGEFCKKKADWMLGMSLSRVESLKYRAGINVGRVQSPTLYFVVKRYIDATNFKVTDYYTMTAELNGGFSVFWSKDSDGRVLDKAVIDAAASEITNHGQGTVTRLETKKAGTDRPQLYDITELQRDANRKYGVSAAVTLAAAQSLYETHKVLSYPRTDSRYITSDLQPYMPGRVKAIGSLPKYKEVAGRLLADGLNLDKRIVDDAKVTDHHALIPTEKIEGFDPAGLIPTPEEAKKGVTAEGLNHILDLILCRVLVAFSKPYYYEQTNITVAFPNRLSFTASGRKPLSLGWRSVQDALLGKEGSDEDDPAAGAGQLFPNLSEGQTVAVRQCITVPKATTPPKLHTEATLLTAMENAGATIEGGAILKGKGIGTQATRAEIIKKLFDTGVVEAVKKGKTTYLQPTPKGISVIRVLPEELYSPKITADWETMIAGIAAGKSSEAAFMSRFTTFIRAKTEEVKKTDTGVVFKKEKEVFGVCPWCGSPVYSYQKKNEKGKPVSTGFYCSESCDFRLNCDDQTFMIRLGRKLTEKEAARLIAKKAIILDCKSRGSDKKYRGEFSFKERISGGKRYCNVQCDVVAGKKS